LNLAAIGGHWMALCEPEETGIALSGIEQPFAKSNGQAGACRFLRTEHS
jgi:hypothetical protein